MAASNQLAIKEVLNLNISKYSNTGAGDSVCYVDYGSSSTVETSAERLD